MEARIEQHLQALAEQMVNFSEQSIAIRSPGRPSPDKVANSENYYAGQSLDFRLSWR